MRSHDYLTTPPPHLSREACRWECQVNSGEWRSHTTCLEGENERTSSHCVWSLPFVSSKMDCQSIFSYSPLWNFGLAELSLPTAASITSLFQVATVSEWLLAIESCWPTPWNLCFHSISIPDCNGMSSLSLWSTCPEQGSVWLNILVGTILHVSGCGWHVACHVIYHLHTLGYTARQWYTRLLYSFSS